MKPPEYEKDKASTDLIKLHNEKLYNTTAAVPRKYHPPVLRHHRLATALAALQVLLGVAVSSLAVWLLIWAPNLRVRDIPYWSGLPLLMSGIMGLLLLCCCHKDYPGMPFGIWMFSVKVISVCMAVVAGVTCFCACVFALLHLIFLTSMTCEPAHVLNATCVCQDVQRTYHYADLNCPEVGNILTILLIGSCAANSIGGILATWYVFLHWSSRYTYLYSEVQNSDNKPIMFSNKLGDPK
ncbi:sarcospan isoform X2 [Zootermopsis nevadensis]|uniref:sarcospan isoform X2 n=1 Tax=Zootermopsis nevadensis TaxID=136037 RepID=UPI000B8E68D0|nr:sarcospan isoform X2 [Zootermopsis nevadensis]